MSRRKFARAGGVVLATGFAAGCLGTDDDDIPDPNGGDDGNGEGNGDGNGEGNGESEDPEEWLSDANGFDGEIEDLTGEDSIEIENGDPEGGANYQFSPAGVRIDAGTTVTWEWIDDDSHSVTEQDEVFDSGIQQDATFEHEFDEAGTYLYYCRPHQSLGQLGAVIVE